MIKLFMVKTAFGITYVVASDFAETEKKFKALKGNEFTEIKEVIHISNNIVI